MLYNGWVLRSPETLDDLLSSTFVRCHRSCVNNHVFDFSSKTTHQIMMKFNHNDHFKVGIRMYS